MALLLYLLVTSLGLSAQTDSLRLGNERMDQLLTLLRGQRVALMVNQASLVGQSQTHLLDSLRARGVQVCKVFVPEHGFRGDVDAGKSVRHGRDTRTGLPIVSLYGRTKRPTAEMLRGVDVILFDLQDVGTRFYTYISSMHYIMEAAAEQDKTVIVTDRPNPNDFVDGPILESDCRSFIGMHPIPIAHGLTVGELARMINGEGWLRGQRRCRLEVVPMLGWRHGQPYSLPVRPSPNLADDRAIALYPTLCLFEATIMSVGRGTDTPFRVLGHPNARFGQHSFTPEVRPGADSDPRYRGQVCYGEDFTHRTLPERRISLAPLIHFDSIARSAGLELIDRQRTFELLVGNRHLRKQLHSGMTEPEIRATWAEGLSRYRTLRQRYLLYPDYTDRD